jgi:hypothetical protein
MQDVPIRGVWGYSVPHSRKFMKRQRAQKAVERRVNSRVDFLHPAVGHPFSAKHFLLAFKGRAFEVGASQRDDDLNGFAEGIGFTACLVRLRE